jgi:hypothetical protein
MINNPPTIFDILQKHLLEGASFSATQGIDYGKNAFTLNVQQIQPSNITITKGDVVRLGLLPSGSKWRQGLGWYSIFGIPFKLQDKYWLAIGAEMIVKHERNDTTHPIFQAYIFEFTQAQLSSIINGLHNVALEIYPNSKSIRQSKTGIVFSNCQSPQKYKVVESFIIQSAIAVYRERQSLLFRTVILSDEQLKKVEYPAPNFWGDKSGYIMGTTSHIQSAFSWQARLKLFMSRAYSFQ